mgnify:CR=1 FL=1
MLFLERSCTIIYSDLSSKHIDNCDSFFSIFQYYNFSSLEFWLFVTVMLLCVYFILKLFSLFQNKKNNNDDDSFTSRTKSNEEYILIKKNNN